MPERWSVPLARRRDRPLAWQRNQIENVDVPRAIGAA